MKRSLLAALAVVLSLTTAPSEAARPTPRATADRPGTSGLRVHLVYLLAQGQRDRRLDTDGTLERVAGSLQAWTRRETGGRTWRLDTWTSGGRKAADVTFVRSAHSSFMCEFAFVTDTRCVEGLVRSRTGGPSSHPVDLVAADLARAGLSDPAVRYLVLVQGTANNICGQGQAPEDTDRDPAHVGHVAAVFLGDPNCPNDAPGSGGQVDWALAHELLHNDGAVPLGAPHVCTGTAGHVCTAGLANGSPYTDALDPERADIMYPAPGAALNDVHLDRGHDDYYGTTVGLRDVADSPYLTGVSR